MFTVRTLNEINILYIRKKSNITVSTDTEWSIIRVTALKKSLKFVTKFIFIIFKLQKENVV